MSTNENAAVLAAAPPTPEIHLNGSSVPHPSTSVNMSGENGYAKNGHGGGIAAHVSHFIAGALDPQQDAPPEDTLPPEADDSMPQISASLALLTDDLARLIMRHRAETAATAPLLPAGTAERDAQRAVAAHERARKSDLEGIVKNWAIDQVDAAAALGDRDLAYLQVKIGAVAGVGWCARSWRPLVSAATERLSSPPERTGGDGAPFARYATHDGRLCQCRVVDGSLAHEPIADFTAEIVEAITCEDSTTYTISGNALRGGEFSCEVDAKLFADIKVLRATLEAAAGPRDSVYPGMADHLGPAIKFLTQNPHQVTRHLRTGWAGDKFLMPGRTVDGHIVSIPSKLAYHWDADGDVGQGVAALENLIEFVGPQVGTVIVSHFLAAPLANVVGWRGERSALFMAGRTGTHKTSTSQLLMCLYGGKFSDETNLIRWGAQGSTANSIITYATSAGDLPLLVDNYKPNTGGGAPALVNLIHAILEGGGKDRLSRSSKLIEPKPIHCWPVFTGEDVPDNDAAALARMIVVQFERQHSTDKLSAAQALATHLPAVGRAWIEWLEGDEGRGVATKLARALPDVRASFVGALTSANAGIKNPYRIATNLAVNTLTWRIAAHHPALRPLVAPLVEAHTEHLTHTAAHMADATAESLEAERFLAKLAALLANGTAALLPWGTERTDLTIGTVIGWLGQRGVNSGAYVLLDAARQVVARQTGDELNGISNRALISQLREIHAIGQCDAGRSTKNIKIGGVMTATVHIEAGHLVGEMMG